MEQNKNYINEMYLDYVNNFLTVSVFAQYYGITEELANMIIIEGRNINEGKPQS